MARLTLKKLFQKGSGQFLFDLFRSLDQRVVVLDMEGTALLGADLAQVPTTHEGSPVLFNNQTVGWVVSEKSVQWQSSLAALLSFLLEREAEKKALAAEVLDKYRELHLLYRLSEKLVVTPQPEAVASMALDEACPLIQVAGGLVVLKQETGDGLDILASCGNVYRFKADTTAPGNIIQRVLQSGIAELANDLPAEDYFDNPDEVLISLLCSPLKTETQILGAIILIGDQTKQFTAGDLKLLSAIAMQTAPAIEIAHLHQLELERIRMERDLQTAHQVQASLLPRKMPVVAGWQIAAFWQPARAVSGDYYDFISFPDGKLGLVIADVSSKGVPASLVMANTRSVLRAVAVSDENRRGDSPGRLLARVNDLLCEEMPRNMFVTCLVAVIDPVGGHICCANAGHPLPCLRTSRGVIELRATGLPLGFFPGMVYEEKETVLKPGESFFMYSDGLIEAHNPQGEMFSTGRLHQLLSFHDGEARLCGDDLIQSLMTDLGEFTGPDWEQEDDVTMLVLERDSLN